MKLSQLEQTHPHYDHGEILRHSALFEGGQKMRKHMRLFLTQHAAEPSQTYERRLASATYLNYGGPVVNALTSWLFTSSMSVRVRETEGDVIPKWAAKLQENASAKKDLGLFLRGRVIEALVQRRSFWKVEAKEAPPGLALAEWERMGYDRLQLCAVPTKRVTNWQCDDEGRFVWLLEREEFSEQEDIDSPAAKVIEWTQYHSARPPRSWRMVIDPKEPAKPDDVVPEKPSEENRAGVPFVCMELPVELWVLSLIADPLVEILRKRNALSWAIDQNCFVTPVLYSDSKKPIGVLGTGYYLRLGASDRFEYPSIPGVPFAALEQHIGTLKDELYRIVQQMAASVDNNAAAIGRSGESKQQDLLATQIVLKALGMVVREAIEQTFDLAAQLLGTGETFSAHGLDTFRTEDVGSIRDVIDAVGASKIDSPTLSAELAKRLAAKALPDASAETIKKISQEIDEQSSPSETPVTQPSATDARGAVPTTGADALNNTAALPPNGG